ncbi:sphingomyelin phosphodiesterase [Polypterus senegalus]|uniref:sphingomyelin phosphodiesterase n=1 Tax=Polypterus senegalus TaxID=55291 RepID=UPI001965FF92|nr:sphingomyelin phosphodiesterase [Polypterus senegalus]
MFITIIFGLLVLCQHTSFVTGIPVAERDLNRNLGHVVLEMKQHFTWRNMTCPLCKTAFGILNIAMQIEKNKDYVASLSAKICVWLHFEEPNICTKITELFKEDVIAAVMDSVLRPSEICAVLFGEQCGHFDIFSEWNITLPRTPKPPVIPPVPPNPSAPRSRILFLTDVHWDRDYAEGSSIDCKEPLCCRSDSSPAHHHQTGAGRWGSYSKCDLPLHTVENLLQHLAATGPWDWVYWTGDIPAHNVWDQTRDQQLLEIKTISKLIRKYLGNLPVYPAVGNHESAPVNSFPPPFIIGNHSSSWLYNAIADEWAVWLAPEAQKTIRWGGFYTMQIRPDLRLVSLNMNFCAKENFWLLVNDTDPAGQLQWLIGVLQQSEMKGEKVHIIGHIPPGLCLKTWSWNYYKIVNRFESTIASQFFGHTHLDEFQMFYDEETLTRPVSVAFIAPSVTTFINLNPGYRVYEIDGDYPGSSRIVVDHETYILNLTEANMESTSIHWKRLYNARENYELKTLFPSDWDNLIRTFQKNDSVFQNFWHLYHKGHISEPCQNACKATVLCSLRSGRSGDPQLCLDMLPGLSYSEIEKARYRTTMC